MTTLTESAQALWDLLDRDGFDATVVLILADCLEEQGGPDHLWEGLRAMVSPAHRNGPQERWGSYWWYHTDEFSYAHFVEHMVFCFLSDELRPDMDSTPNAKGYEYLSQALLAYARAWVSVHIKCFE